MVIKTDEREYEIDENQGTLKISPRRVSGNKVVTGKVIITLSAEEFRQQPGDLVALGKALVRMGAHLG